MTVEAFIFHKDLDIFLNTKVYTNRRLSNDHGQLKRLVKDFKFNFLFISLFYRNDPTFYENLCLGFTARACVGTVLLPMTVVKARYEVCLFCWKKCTSNFFRANVFLFRLFICYIRLHLNSMKPNLEILRILKEFNG